MQKFTCSKCDGSFAIEPTVETSFITCPHCGYKIQIESAEREYAPGTSVNGFEIIRLIGRGGMGNVYLANQLSMNRKVALKMLSPSLIQDREITHQFLNEIQVSGRLHHANIITAIDAGEFQGTYYLVVNYIDGKDFDYYIDNRIEFSEKEILEIAVKIGNALKYAWETHKLLHRDIKPGNIMNDNAGEVYLMDMGIAQSLNQASSGTRSEHILGSPLYMSPEQAKGDPLDWRSDLYSLGATLYHMLVGVPPYDHEEVMTIVRMHVTDPFPEPATRNPSAKVSPAVVDLIRKMMAKSKDERFSSWDEFVRAVENVSKPKKQPKTAGTNTGIPLKSASKSRGRKKSGKAFPKKISAKTRKSSSVAMPLKQARSGSGAGIILVYLILIAAAVFAAVVVFNHRKKTQIEDALAVAEDYYRRNPEDYAIALDQFEKVKNIAKDTSSYPDIQDRYEQVWNDALEFQARVIREAEELLEQEKYQEAAHKLQEGKKVPNKEGLNKIENLLVKLAADWKKKLKMDTRVPGS